MILDEGFEHGNAEIRLGQLAEALTRLARTIVGIRLHTEDLSVEQGVRFFKEEAYLEEGTARQEAERGTFDPGYTLYALGKQMMVKLREQTQKRRHDQLPIAKGFSLQRFHNNVLGHGIRPILDAQGVDGSGRTGHRVIYRCLSTNTNAAIALDGFERIQKFSDPIVKTCPTCGGPVQKLPSSPAIQFKGTGWYVTDYAKKTDRLIGPTETNRNRAVRQKR